MFTKNLAKFLAAISLISISSTASSQEIIPGEYIIKFSEKDSYEEMLENSEKLNLDIVKENSITKTYFAKGELDQDAAKELTSEDKIEFIEPNCVVKKLAEANDRFASAQWSLNNNARDIDIDAKEAWDTTTGSEDIIVGIIDSGINYNHPDLKDNIWKNSSEIPGNGIDDDRNGVIDDYYGFNAVSGNGDPFDNNGHGSHCAGIIGAEGNNSIGITGINWNVKLMGLKFLDGAGAGTTQNAVEAIEYAVKMKNAGHNIRVLNNSWGGNLNSPVLEEAVRKTNEADILFVAASGNFGTDNDINPIYPASYNYENVVSVSAIDKEGNLAPFANYGRDSVDLAAPGMEIMSTGLQDKYNVLSGTSMAAPHVAGVAALTLSKEPNLDSAALKSRLTSTIRPLSSLSGLLQNSGIVNANFALNNTKAPASEDSQNELYSQSKITANPETDLGEKIYALDDGYVEISLPFNFPFYQENFNKLAVSANGRVVPLAASESAPRVADYSNGLRAGILPWHDDLTPDGTSNEGIWAKSDSNSLTLNWFVKSFDFRNSSNTTDNIRIQLKLFSNGTIEFHYIDVDTTAAASLTASGTSIGIVPFNIESGARVKITHNDPIPEVISSGEGLRFTLAGGVSSAPLQRVDNDFDGDGKSDIIVWRPSNGYWFILTSGSNFNFDSHQAHQLGLPGDIPKLGYFDNDTKIDLATFRPSTGQWFIKYSKDNYSTINTYFWGLSGDEPVVGDVDGDGIDDLSVFRPGFGVFFSLLSSKSFNPLLDNSIVVKGTGAINYKPFLEDINLDGLDDFLMFNEISNHWVGISLSNELLENRVWGIPTDQSLVCDLSGNGSKELIIVRQAPVNSWLSWFSSENFDGESFFGLIGDEPECSSDYNGDGINDLRVWRPSNGSWYISYSNQSQSGAESVNIDRQFGLPGDITF